MFKYFAIILLIPLIVTSGAVVIAIISNPETPVDDVPVYGYIYEVSTLKPDGSPVFLFITENIDPYIISYNTTDVYEYICRFGLTIPTGTISQNKIESFKVVVFKSSTPILRETRSLSWDIVSKMIQYIEANKIAETGLSHRGSFTILDKLFQNNIYVAVIVEFKPDTRVNDIGIGFYYGPRFGHAFSTNTRISEIIELDLNGDYSASQAMSWIRSNIASYLNINMSVFMKMRISLAIVLRIITGVLIAIALLYIDYRWRPEEYQFVEGIKKFFKRSK